MQETGTSCTRYLPLCNTRASHTTRQTIQSHSCQPLQLWAYLDNQYLWFELLKRGSRGSKDPVWLHDLVRSEIGLGRTSKKLLAYALIEPYQDTERYKLQNLLSNFAPSRTPTFGAIEREKDEDSSYIHDTRDTVLKLLVLSLSSQ